MQKKFYCIIVFPYTKRVWCYIIEMLDCVILYYRIAENFSRRKLWRIWQFATNSPKFYPPIAKLHDCFTHYGKRPFMVSRKVKLHRNILEIITGTRFQSHNNYILPYILMKFRMAQAKSSRYTMAKTAHESHQLNSAYGC